MEGSLFVVAILVVIVMTPCLAEIPPIHFSVEEEKPINFEVGNVAVKGRLAENRSAEEFNTLRYTLLSDNAKYQSLFRLNDISGILYIDKVINRDVLCSIVCDLKFQVLVSTQEVDIIDLTVTILDINDNPPVFPHRSLKIDILENNVPNFAYDINQLAYDNDTTVENSIVKYDYSPKSSVFSVEYRKLLSGDFKVKLIVKTPLDRELKGFYQLYLIAIDGGSEPRSDQMLLNISVTDVNDNPPVFDHQSYPVSVKEDASPNTAIIKLTATDKDIGENARVTYRMITTNMEDASILELFKVDAATGEVVILKALKYTGEVYSIIVEATDHGASPKTAQARVQVSVEDSGNNAPVIKVNVISSNQGVVSISENINIDGFVAHVSVEDSDKGDNGKVVCDLANTTYFKVEEITKGYKVVVKTKLDRETIQKHNVTVICHDLGSPVQMTSSESFIVEVFDENDNDPVFLKNVYETKVKEGNSVGIYVESVSATDRDKNMNAKLQYFLHSDAGSNFAINSNSGVITASSVFDRETIPNSQLKFHVLAVDRGDPPRTGTAVVLVNISDINDNPPKFNRSIFAFYIAENKPSDSVVGKLLASDLDKGENSRLSYEMAKEDESDMPFIVFPDGVIKTNQELDRELKPQYNFAVYVYDHGQTSLNASAYVTVFVTDLNDNKPAITFPNKKNSTIWSTSSTSLPITTIQAHDIDDGVNKKLVYTIYSGNENNVFYLDRNSGELFINQDFPFTKDVSASLVICVKDSGNPVLTNCAQLNTIVTVTNATAAALEERSNNYIIISIVVVIVTVLVSIAIILTIFFLKKIDRNRLKQQKYLANGPLGVPVSNSYSPSPASSQHDVSSDAEYMERKKKEVTFSPSTSFREPSDKSLHVTTDTKPGSYLYDLPPSDAAPNKQTSQLNAVHLQQMLSKSNQNSNYYKPNLSEAHNVPRGHPGDNHSDTSQETTTSDSGRGNSEEDVPSSAMTTDDRSFECPSYSSIMNSSQSPPYVPPRKDRTVPVHNRIKPQYSNTQLPPNQMGYNSCDRRHYKSATPLPQGGGINSPPSHYNKSDNYHPSQYNVDSKLNSLNLSTWKYLQHQQPHSDAVKYNNMDKERDYFNLRPGSLSTLRSREDDDDAATTTSGSYTINHEELDDELYRIPKDLVV